MTTLDARPAIVARRQARRRHVDPIVAAAVGWLVLLVAGVFVVRVILDVDPLALDATARFSGLSADNWLGTDDIGRDLLARCLDGARVSLLIGLGSTALAMVIGVPVGMLAGYRREGTVDAAISFGVDVILGFPGLVLALALAAFLGASTTNVMIAITVPLIPVFVRLARVQTLAVLTREFVEASRVIGTPPRSIMWRDVIPNIAELVLAFALVTVGRVILIEGGLSFLGIGVPQPQPTWGSMINEGRLYLDRHALIILAPSAFLMLTIFSINITADRFLFDRSTAGVGT